MKGSKMQSPETFAVDPDDIIRAMERNNRDQNKARSHTIRFNTPLKGRVTGSLFVSRDGHYYQPGSPSPIHIAPETFLSGHSDKPARPDQRHPERNESEGRFREEMGYLNEDGTYYDLDDAEQAEWEEWWETELGAWRDIVRAELVDEVTINVEPDNPKTISVEYTTTTDE